MFLFLWFFLSLISAPLLGKPLDVKVTAKSAILINADTGATLYEKKADDKVYPASLTKIATCLYIVQDKEKGLDLEEVIVCPHHCLRRMSKSVKVARGYKDPPHFLEPDGSHYMIKREEEMQIKDLLYGLMIASGNDAANCLAHHFGGTIPDFMQGLNDYLKEIGCLATHFANPHGLHHPNHYSTARDIALMTREAIKLDLIQSIVGSQEHKRLETNLQTAKMIQTRNQLLQPGPFFYPQAVGMKTGYHEEAGYTYAAVARKEGRTLIAVLLGYFASKNQRFQEAIRLFDAAFEEEIQERLLFASKENIFTRSLKKGKQELHGQLGEDVAFLYYPAEEPEIRIELNWEHRVVPIQKGSFVGSINVFDQGENIIASAPLFALENVERNFIALVGDAARGEWVCPQELQKVLTFFLLIGLGSALLLLFPIQRAKKGREVGES